MIEAMAPGRVVLVGDHTDHAGGVSLTMAIDRSTTIRGERLDGRVRLRSDRLPGLVDLDAGRPVVDDTVPGWGRLVAGVAAEVAAAGAATGHGLEGHVRSTVPLGAGLSSSAALELALALALGFEGTAVELARLGQRAEHRALGVPCGLLDQLTSACGRAGHALLLDLADGVPDDELVEAVPMPDELDVVVVHSGQERVLEGSAYATRRSECERAAEVLGPLPLARADDIERIGDPLLRRRARHVAGECDRVRRAANALRDGDGEALGRLMVESHASLRDDFEVSTPALDTTVERLLAVPGVLGARLTGAGFGGCVVALTEAGAVPDPSELTGRGWLVRAADGASVRER